MSSGNVHSKASLILAAGFSLVAMISLEPKILECTVGALVGVVLSGDLDLSNGGIVGGDLIKKKFGWRARGIWKWFWKDYSDSFKHGSWSSHFPVFGTVFRLAYIYFKLIIPFYLVAYLIVNAVGFGWDLIGELKWWAVIMLNPMFLYGLSSSDTIHYFLDKLTTAHKS
jgi:uncharacterized metal-binding protein